MQEIELKFQIPATALDALRTELSALPGGQWPLQRLQAAYFDTPDRKLARARAALRVRQEDDDWVQTLKAAGANAMTRLEDNKPVPAPRSGQAITPDLSRHTDEHVRQALVRDLGWQPEADPRGEHTGLIQLYRTDMQRQRAQLPIVISAKPHVSGSVEIALDMGLIAAGGLSVPVRELEIELLDGDARAVLVAAQDLVTRYALWLDVQTKAHRGDQLAREATSGQPSPLPPARPRAKLKPDASPTQAWLIALDCCIEHISANLSEVALAGIDQNASQEAVDKSPWVRAWARGLRRLMRLGPTPPGTSVASGEPPALMANLQALLRQLRPAPGLYLDTSQAATLARSVDTTLLSLKLLNTLLAAS